MKLLNHVLLEVKLYETEENLICNPYQYFYADDAKNNRGRSSPSRRMRRFEKFRHEKRPVQTPRVLEVRHEDMYVLIEPEEIKYYLEVNQKTIN